MEIKRILLNIAINKLHARAAVVAAAQADVVEYLSMQSIWGPWNPVSLFMDLREMMSYYDLIPFQIHPTMHLPAQNNWHVNIYILVYHFFPYILLCLNELNWIICFWGITSHQNNSQDGKVLCVACGLVKRQGNFLQMLLKYSFLGVEGQTCKF